MTELQYDIDLAVAFLEEWSNGPWILTAINPNKREDIETRTFVNPGAMGRWLEANNGRRNNYHTINRTKPGVYNKKPKKGDIGTLVTLHVDADLPKGPKATTDIEAAQAALLDRIKAFVPMPSVIILSGGGYNC